MRCGSDQLAAQPGGAEVDQVDHQDDGHRQHAGASRDRCFAMRRRGPGRVRRRHPQSRGMRPRRCSITRRWSNRPLSISWSMPGRSCRVPTATSCLSFASWKKRPNNGGGSPKRGSYRHKLAYGVVRVIRALKALNGWPPPAPPRPCQRERYKKAMVAHNNGRARTAPYVIWVLT